MNLDTIELHDAIFKHLHIDPFAGTISIALDYYPDENAAARCPATIRFEQVSQHSLIVDFKELASNARAGNIVSWRPSAGQGTTFIHLALGLVSVTAKRCHFIR